MGKKSTLMYLNLSFVKNRHLEEIDIQNIDSDMFSSLTTLDFV